MKKIVTPAALVLALLLSAFFKEPQPAALRKISGNLYEARTTASISAADQAKLKLIILRQYGIRSFNETVIVHYTPEKGLEGNGVAMAEQKLSNAAFQQTIVEDGNEEVKQSCIYTHCSANPAMGDVLQVLASYNVH